MTRARRQGIALADDGVVQIIVIGEISFFALPVFPVALLDLFPDGAPNVAAFTVVVTVTLAWKHRANLLVCSRCFQCSALEMV